MYVFRLLTQAAGIASDLKNLEEAVSLMQRAWYENLCIGLHTPHLKEGVKLTSAYARVKRCLENP